MSPTLPFCCNPAAFNLLARQSWSIDSPDALVYGAAAIAMHRSEDVDPAAVDAQLQSYADAVRARVRGSQEQALMAHLHDVLFEEEKFSGNNDDYYDPANSYLPSVLETKKGLPITLSLIYRVVAERVGLRVWGVGLPGRFMVGSMLNGKIVLIDPFARGRLVTPDEARQSLQVQFGDGVEWSDDLLRPATNRHWLTRMLQNLLNLFGSGDHYTDVAAVLEMEMLLWPDQHHLQRDLGLVLARCGMAQPACVWLDHYLQANPDDPQTSELKQLLDVLR